MLVGKMGITKLAFEILLFPQHGVEMKDSEQNRQQGDHGRRVGDHRPTYPYALIAYAVG